MGQLVLRILELDNPLLLRETEAGDEKVRTYFDDSIGRNSSDCNPQRMRKLGKLEWEWDQLGELEWECGQLRKLEWEWNYRRRLVIS